MPKFIVYAEEKVVRRYVVENAANEDAAIQAVRNGDVDDHREVDWLGYEDISAEEED